MGESLCLLVRLDVKDVAQKRRTHEMRNRTSPCPTFMCEMCAVAKAMAKIILLTYFYTLNRTEKTSLPKVCKPSTVQNCSQLIHYELCYTFLYLASFQQLSIIWKLLVLLVSTKVCFFLKFTLIRGFDPKICM